VTVANIRLFVVLLLLVITWCICAVLQPCRMNALDSCDGHGTAVHSESRDRALTSSVNARSRDSECTAVPWPSPDGAFILAFIITAPSPSGGRGHELNLTQNSAYLIKIRVQPTTPSSDNGTKLQPVVRVVTMFNC
jgi:hypothetical protein